MITLIMSLAMILSCGFIAMLTRKDPADPQRHARLTRLLWGLIAAAMTLLVALHAIGWGGAANLGFFLFFPLMSLSIATLNARNPANTGATPPRQTRRVALLADRTAFNPVPAWAWSFGWLAWAAALAFIVVQWVDAGSSRQVVLALALQAGVGLVPLLVTPWAIRRSLQEPEPLDASASEDLRRGYERLRRSRCWLFFGLALVMELMTSAGMVVLAMAGRGYETDRIAGLAGGIAGSLIGVMGAAAGVYMGVKRARLNDLLWRRSREEGVTDRREGASS